VIQVFWATRIFLSCATAIAVVSGLVIGISGCHAQQDADVAGFAERRAEMLAVIAWHARATSELTGFRRIDPHVMAAMGTVPRHEFVPEEFRDLAYMDRPLPVDREQNIAQPYLVALMTQLAGIETGDVVFETGTGAGYHAAVLSLLAARVISVEVVSLLAARASAKLGALGYDNVEVIAADGYYGAPGKGPFDAMIVKEAVDHVPLPLLAQLKPGGRLVLPLGPLEGPQFLTVVEKLPDGRTRGTRILPVTFTPLQGGQRI